MVDTIDDARIHLAAALDSTVKNERIFACDTPFNWGLVIKTILEIQPDATLPTAEPDEPMAINTWDNALGGELLKKWWGQPGYKGLKQTILESLELCEELQKPKAVKSLPKDN